MKDWMAPTALLVAFAILMMIGGTVVCSTQPNGEYEKEQTKQEVVYDKKMKDPSGHLTKEQRDAVEAGRFEELNEV